MGNQVQLSGRVVTGLGVAGPATSLDWFREALKRLWGFEPVPGTLNVIIAGDGNGADRQAADQHGAEGQAAHAQGADRQARARHTADRLLLTAGTVLVPPTPGLCCSVLLPARIGKGGRSEQAVMFRPMVHGYNPDQLEFVAPVNLREALGLQDGDEVTVTVEDSAPAHKWVAPRGVSPGVGAGVGAGADVDSGATEPGEPDLPGLQTGQARITVDLSTGPLQCQVLWAITQQGVSASLFGGIPHVGSTALAIPRPSLKDPTRTSATSSVLNVTGHKDDALARRLAESLAAGLNRVAAVTAGVHAGPEGVYDLSPEDLKRIVNIVGRVDEIIRMAAGKGKV